MWYNTGVNITSYSMDNGMMLKSITQLYHRSSIILESISWNISLIVKFGNFCKMINCKEYVCSIKISIDLPLSSVK